MNAPIKRIAIENPVSCISTEIRKPDCIVHPYHFGDRYQKNTCFWLKNLPPLKPTNIVDKGEFYEWIDSKGRNRKYPKWGWDAFLSSSTPEERRTLRSKTFKGMSLAIAQQWGSYMLEDKTEQLKLFEGV